MTDIDDVEVYTSNKEFSEMNKRKEILARMAHEWGEYC